MKAPVLFSTLAVIVLTSLNSMAAPAERHCGTYEVAAHTTYLNTLFDEDGIDFLDSKVQAGVEFPAYGTWICVTGSVAQLNGRKQFVEVQSIGFDIPLITVKDDVRCGRMQTSAHTSYIDDGTLNGVAFVGSNLSKGVSLPKIGSCSCVSGKIGLLNQRLQFIVVNKVEAKDDSLCAKAGL